MIGLVLGPLVFVTIYLTPFQSLTPEAHRLLAILGLVFVFWVSEVLPLAITTLIGVILAGLLGIGTPKEILAPFADPVVFLLMGSFFLAQAISIHGLGKRFATLFLSRPILAKSPRCLLVTCGLIPFLISMWLSNSATTAMMLPIILGILDRDRKFETRALLMLAYGASVGGLGTLVGTPTNLIGVGLLEETVQFKISFGAWLPLAMPMTILMFLALCLILCSSKLPSPLMSKQETSAGRQKANCALFPDARSATELAGGRGGCGGSLAPRAVSAQWSRGEINTLIAFGTAVFLWILPSLCKLFCGSLSLVSVLEKRLDEGLVALLAASLLFMLPVSLKEKKLTLSWREAAQIDWGTLLLFGGGLALGKLMFATGLANALGTFLLALTGAEGLWGITAVGIATAILMSEATSNVSSATMIVPVMIALAQAKGISPVPPALGATIGASFGFMLPISTPPNAIVYGSGKIPLRTMIRTGIVFDLIGFAIIWIALRLLCPLLGWSS